MSFEYIMESQLFFVNAKMKKILVLFLLFSLATQAQARLQGYIYDSKTKENLVAVKVWVEGKNIQITDVSGYFAMDSLPEGKYILKGSYVGYDTLTEEVLIRKGRTTLVNFCMKPCSVALKIPEEKIKEPIVDPKFDKSIHKADSCFALKKFKSAAYYYMEAGNYAPQLTYWLNRRVECDRLLNDKKNEYEIDLGTGDVYFMTATTGSADFFESAALYYKMAAQLRPAEKYPRVQLKEIERLKKKK